MHELSFVICILITYMYVAPKPNSIKDGAVLQLKSGRVAGCSK